MIHKTLTDNAGNTYRLVSSRWLKALTMGAAINFFLLMVAGAIIIENARAIDETTKFSTKVGQRNSAVADISGSRIKANKWAFDRICADARKLGETCPEVKWYADPSKFPLIADDVTGAGLFPEK